MHTISFVPLIYLGVLVVLLVAGYIIKNSVINMLRSSQNLDPSQIDNGITIVNTIYYALVIILLLIVVAPFFIYFIGF